MLAALAGEPIVALDTESDSLYRYFYKVCLIQLSTPTTDYVIDPLRLPDLAPLGALLADPTAEKVFHAAENDILVLKRDFGFSFARIFDTMLAARILGWRQVGLAALLAEQFGVELDKRTQLTDWGRRPLTPDQLSYARLDSRYLLPLRDLLAKELQTRGRWREAQEAFAALPAVIYEEKPFDPNGFWRNKWARDLSQSELAVLRELYLWRDRQARQMDRPPFKVLDDQTLVRLSQSQPRRLEGLRLSHWQVRHFGRAILEAIVHGRAAPPPHPPIRLHNGDGRPDAATSARYDRLRAWRSQRAAARGVDSDVVLTNEALMAIARARPATLADLAALGVLGAWKLEEYGAGLLRVLDGEGKEVDKETRRQGDKETRRQGDKETRRQGDKETRRQVDKEVPSLSPCHPVTLSPCHPFTLSPLHLVTSCTAPSTAPRPARAP
jgi:ribonuclease D